MEGNGRAIYEKGQTDKALSHIRILLDKHFTFSQIADLLNFSEEEQQEYLTLLNQQ